MRIRTSGLGPEHTLDYVTIVRDLLRALPPEHTAGLDYVTISGDPPLEDDDDVLGQYYDRFETEAPGIVLYLATMRHEVPAPLRRFAITWKVLIAQTLYHEVGHHYQHFTHGIARDRQEDHAESYGDRWSRAAFPGAYAWIDRFERLRNGWTAARIHLLGLAVRMRPSAALHYRIGNLHEMRGDLHRAVEQWERALVVDPGFAPVQSVLPAVRTRLERRARKLRLEALKPAAARARRGRKPRKHPGRRKSARRGRK